MEAPIQVTYKHTSNVYTANQLLAEIAQYPIISWDLEVAVKHTPEELDAFRAELATNPPKRRRIKLQSMLAATALDHPSHCTITHCSIGVSDHEAYVFILDNTKITNRVLNYLVTSTQKQILHNATYDFKHLYYHTGRMPTDYEDSQIFAKSILNHVEVHKATTGLKELAGARYGAWAISDDNFTTASYYDPKMLLYAATDACATLWLYHSINRHVETTNENDTGTSI